MKHSLRLRGGVLFAAAVLVFANVFAADEPAFQPTQYPRVKVRHMPEPEPAREKMMPRADGERNKVPVLKSPHPKGGKMMRSDESFLVQDLVPARTNGTNAIKAQPHRY